MAYNTQHINCPKCLRTFELTEHNAGSIPSEKESYDCPYTHCDYSHSLRSSGYFTTEQINVAGKYVTEGQILNALMGTNTITLMHSLVKKLSKISGYQNVDLEIIEDCKSKRPADASTFKSCIQTKLKLKSRKRLIKKSK